MVEFRRGDAQVLPFADNSFDIAVMALVITFIPDPAKAITEMMRAVGPGGWVATYMWDTLHGGAPGDPIYSAAKAFGVPRQLAPSAQTSQRETMQALWEAAGLGEIDTRVIKIPVTYPDFDDFWDSNTVPIGLPGKMIQGMAPDARKGLQEHVRAHLPRDSQGRISYEAFANAVKGRVPM
jgi:ubiquinone/menaquinone biosynthesis C-methylase UbiE